MKKLKIIIFFSLLLIIFSPTITKASCTWRSESITTNPKIAFHTNTTGGCQTGETRPQSDSQLKCDGAQPSGSSSGATTIYICCCSAPTASTYVPPKFILPDIQIPIPGLTLTPSSSIQSEVSADGKYSVSIPWIGQYINSLYNYGVAIAGILAAIILMAGGLLWLISGGDASKVTQAKELIEGSVTGLVIVMTSYLLLFTVNPELTKFKPIIMGAVQHAELTPGNETSEGSNSAFFQCVHEQYGSSEQEVSTNLTTVNFLNKNYRVNNKMAIALNKAQQQITSAGITYKSTDTSGGGFNWRANANDPNQQSLHSFGIAIDINPTKNPNYSSKERPCKTDIPQNLINILKNNGFRWGGEYKNVCDSMHFEWVSGNSPCKIN